MRKSIILTIIVAFIIGTAALPSPAFAELIDGKCYNSVIVPCPPGNSPGVVCANLYEVPCHPKPAGAASGASSVAPTVEKKTIQPLKVAPPVQKQ
jgi:hypothetical protein